MSTWRLLTALALVLAGAALSGVLLLEHRGEPVGVSMVEGICGEGPATGCAEVAASPYSKLGTVTLSGIGLFYYLALAVLLALGLQAAGEVREGAAAVALALSMAGLAVDVMLLGVQAFALRSFCAVCGLTYLATLGAAGALWPARRSMGTALRLPVDREGRLVLVGWASAALALGAGVWAVEILLATRAEGRQAERLGAAPPHAAAPRTLEEAQAELTSLRGLLDDPQRLQQYLTARAVEQFQAEPVQPLDLSRTPFLGPADAPIQVVVFSDFLCPFCRQIAEAFHRFMQASAGRVQLHFKHYPLDRECDPGFTGSTHPGACLVAKGAVCAQAQQRFWPFHDRAFAAGPGSPGRPDLLRLAREVGLDTAVLEACLDSASTLERIAGEIAEARRAGVRGTPTVFVNGKRVARVNYFLAVLDAEAQRLGLPLLQPGVPPPPPR
jgi:protein-disulfide isomerase/uncharacterized membrane protein